MSIVQENTEYQNESMTTDRHENEETNATATTTPSQAAHRPPHFMIHKHTVHCNQGERMNKDTEEERAKERLGLLQLESRT
jgi:hypothetical protein